SGNIDDFDFSPLIFDKNNNYQSVKVVSKKSLNSNPKLFQITGTIDNFIDKNAPFKCQMYIYKTGTNIDVQPDTPPQISDCKLTNGFANDFGKINITVAPAQVLGTTQPFTIKGSLSSGSVSDYDFSLLISDNNNNNPSVKVIKTEMINNNPKLFLLTGTVDNYFEKNAPYNCQLYVYLKNGNVEVQPNPPPERSNCKLSPGYTIDFGIIVIKTSPPPANPIQTFKIRAIITDNMAGRSWNTLTKKVTIEDENGDAANITSQSPYVEQDLKQITTTVSINNFDATHTYTCKMQILDGTTILNTSIPTITPCRLAGINMTSFDLKDTTPSSAPPAPTQQVYFTVDVNVKNTEVVDKRLQYNQLNVKVAIIDPSGNEVVSQAKDLTGNVEDINIKSFDFTNITILKSDVSKNFTCLIRTKNIRDNSPFSYDPSSFVCKPNTVTGPLTISFNATDPDKLKLGTMKIVGRLKPKSGVPNDLLNFVKKDWNFIAAVYETNKTTRKTVDLTKNTLVHQYEDMGIYEFACSSDNEYRISNVIFNFSEMKSAGSARGISVPYMDGKTYQCNGVSLGWELDVFPNM
ncbi:MAG: hypothetical protein Q7R95_00760, partial [bacterium]|nr:hypothetical protein [bacterium]